MVNSLAKGGNNGKNLFGIEIPFPNSFFNPISPSAFAPPVAIAGATFETAFVARGRSFEPRLTKLENKFPPCFTERVICVLLIFISDPVPFAIDFFIFAI